MIHSVRLGVTLGLIWSLTVFVLSVVDTSVIKSLRYGGDFFDGIASIYPACKSKTMGGRVLCAVMAFADVFTLGVLIGVIYNALPIKF
jgi:hypothetical protein